MKNVLRASLLGILVFFAATVSVGHAETDFKLKLKYGTMFGGGEKGNEFTMMPGVVFGYYGLPEKKSMGMAWSVGYQRLNNEVGDSSTGGNLFTVSQLDLFFHFFDVQKLYWSLGLGWDTMKFEGTSHYDQMITIPASFLYRMRVWERNFDVSLSGRYIVGNSLGQNFGVDLAASIPVF